MRSGRIGYEENRHDFNKLIWNLSFEHRGASAQAVALYVAFPAKADPRPAMDLWLRSALSG